MLDDPIPLKILVVDDDPSIRLLMPSFLKSKGAEVLKASDGDEAVEIARAERPDLILLDINMPTMSGLEACQALKGDPDVSEIPIIFMTSLGNDADRLEGFKVGGDDYVIKPINHMEVGARIRRYVVRRAERIRREKLRQLLTRCRERADGVISELAPGRACDVMTELLADLCAAQHVLDEDASSSSPPT